MNVLLVDDDRFVVSSLEQKINWKDLGIEQIYSAYNIRQAKKIFEQHPIHILISDIEMPRGSGLELLAWIRSEGFDIQAIFLTNFANFNYAQKAIELQSFEYFLKPVEFEKLEFIIKKAVKKVKVSQMQNDAIKAGQYWQKYKEKIVENFWMDYLKPIGPISDEKLQELLKDKNLDYSIHDCFLPMILKIFPYRIADHKEIRPLFTDDILVKDQLRKLILDVFKGYPVRLEALIGLGTKNEDYLSIMKVQESACMITQQELIALGNALIAAVNRQLQCDMQFIVDCTGSFSRIPTMVKQLLTFDEETIHFRNQTIVFQTGEQNPAKYVEPNLQLLEHYLQTGNRTGFINKCHQYLTNLLDKNSLNHHVLRSFRLDITQLIYTHLKEKQILAHHLFHGKVNDFLLEKSTRSIEDLMAYISYLVHVSLDYMAFTDSRKSVVKTICDYIDRNYQENITRNDLAKIVYLSPDYIARLFKKETGMSLVNYITKKRIDIAKDLLEHTNLPVHVISEKVGYENYSYFTKLFKKVTNFTPMDYRKLFLSANQNSPEKSERNMTEKTLITHIKI
jgi:two-component system response regulator YesN